VYLLGAIETEINGGFMETGVVQAAVIPLGLPLESRETTITAGLGWSRWYADDLGILVNPSTLIGYSRGCALDKSIPSS